MSHSISITSYITASIISYHITSYDELRMKQKTRTTEFIGGNTKAKHLPLVAAKPRMAVRTGEPHGLAMSAEVAPRSRLLTSAEPSTGSFSPRDGKSMRMTFSKLSPMVRVTSASTNPAAPSRSKPL
eukprot:scaffold2191_cov254-Pinguiococcus_pyrenoidosus.AAC.22